VSTVQTTPDAESTPAVSPADADGDVASERRRRHLVEAAGLLRRGLDQVPAAWRSATTCR